MCPSLHSMRMRKKSMTNCTHAQLQTYIDHQVCKIPKRADPALEPRATAEKAVRSPKWRDSEIAWEEMDGNQTVDACRRSTDPSKPDPPQIPTFVRMDRYHPAQSVLTSDRIQTVIYIRLILSISFPTLTSESSTSSDKPHPETNVTANSSLAGLHQKRKTRRRLKVWATSTQQREL
jgi:hypothetical protein